MFPICTQHHDWYLPQWPTNTVRPADTWKYRLLKSCSAKHPLQCQSSRNTMHYAGWNHTGSKKSLWMKMVNEDWACHMLSPSSNSHHWWKWWLIILFYHMNLKQPGWVRTSRAAAKLGGVVFVSPTSATGSGAAGAQAPWWLGRRGFTYGFTYGFTSYYGYITVITSTAHP